MQYSKRALFVLTTIQDSGFTYRLDKSMDVFIDYKLEIRN